MSWMASAVISPAMLNVNVNFNFFFLNFNVYVESPGMFSVEQLEFLVFILLDYVVVWIYHSNRLKWILTYYT